MTRRKIPLRGSLILLATAGCSVNAHHAATSSRADRDAIVTTIGRRATTTNALSLPAWQTFGHSVEGRPLLMRRVGHGHRVVLWIGGIHGDEPQGAVATASLAAAFQQVHLENRATLIIARDDNPDGRARHTRDNANHVDLNRNFPARNFDKTNPEDGGTPLSQPESRALYDLIQHIHPDLVISCHASRGHAYINYDGPAKAIAARFSADSGLPVEASNALGFGTPGSLGSLIGIDRGIPILTIELLRDSSPTDDWRVIRRAALSAIAR